MNILIIGGGNNGSALATKFSQNNNVCLYVSKNNNIENYKKNMQLYNPDNNITLTAKINLITNNIEEGINFADYIFITYPQFLFKDLSSKMMPYLKNKNLIFIPGSGGAELYFKKALKQGCTITGLQRVHAVTRIILRGQLCQESGIRKSLRIATIPQDYSNKIMPIIKELYNMPVEILSNYINLTLINSNSLLHTSRLYSLFKDFNFDTHYLSIPLFYENWNLESSELLIKMDEELQQLLNFLSNQGISATDIIPILKHYESNNAEELTNKICSISSFKGLTTPSVKTKTGLQPDFNSRYFISDFPYGLDMLIEFSNLCNIECQNMKKVSNWYHNLNDTKPKFSLKEFGINNINDLKILYNR